MSFALWATPQRYVCLKEVVHVQGSETAGKAKKKGKTGTQEKTTSAAPSKRKKAVVQSSSSDEDEEQEEESSSGDDTEHFEIERVLHGRRDAETKQEEFLVKFKGDTSVPDFCKSAMASATTYYNESMHLHLHKKTYPLWCDK